MPSTLMIRMSKEMLARVLRPALMACVFFREVTLACAQQGGHSPPAPAVTLFPHSQTARWWISGQDNIISQWHPSFDAKYSGPNSFRTHAEHATPNIATLYTGFQLTSTTEIFMHFE